MTTDASEAIRTLRSLCTALAADHVEAPKIAAGLGEIKEDMGESMPLFVKPSDHSFAQAQVVRVYGSNDVNHVLFDLAPGDLRLRALEEAFGAYTPEPVLQAGRRQAATFSVKSGREYESRILAEVDGNIKNDAHVLRITVTRDPRLD